MQQRGYRKLIIFFANLQKSAAGDVDVFCGHVGRCEHDKSFYYGMQMVCRFFSYHKLISLKPSHCIILGFEPSAKNSVAATKTAYGASFFSPVLSHTYALKYKDNSYIINIKGIIKALKSCSKSPFPVRFMGFPSYKIGRAHV